MPEYINMYMGPVRCMGCTELENRLSGVACFMVRMRACHAVPMQATVIEINADAVDGAINAVRGALAQGLSWAELERLIRDEREAGNPVASLIRKLSLDRNKITVELPDWVEDGLEDAESDSEGDSDDERQPRQTPTVMVCSQSHLAPRVSPCSVSEARRDGICLHQQSSVYGCHPTSYSCRP